METITSPQNPRIKKIITLRKTRNRKKEGLVVIEGEAELKMAVQSGIEVLSFYSCPAYYTDKSKTFRPVSKESFELDEKTFRKISLRESPDGYLGLAKVLEKKLGDLKLKNDPLFLILESIEKPGNLGAILRTADAAGVDAVVICESKTGVYNPSVIRSSLGTVFSNTVIISDFRELTEWLTSKKINIIATTPCATKSYTEANFRKGVAILIGTEHEGLSEKWFEKANVKVKIPMKGKIDSLNASVSAALMVYEAIRQRSS